MENIPGANRVKMDHAYCILNLQRLHTNTKLLNKILKDSGYQSHIRELQIYNEYDNEYEEVSVLFR